MPDVLLWQEQNLETIILLYNTVVSVKQIVQGEFSLDAFRMLIPVNTLGRYHGYNDILGVTCITTCEQAH